MFLLTLFLACAAELQSQSTSLTDSADILPQEEFCATLRGEKICDFYAINDSGEEVILSDLYGQPIVIGLSAGWCGPCIQAAGEMQSKAEALPDVTFLTLLIEDSEGTAPDASDLSQWSNSHGITDAPVWGSSRDLISSDPLELKDHLYLTGWPTFYFIDSEGKLQEYMRGYDANTIIQKASELN